MMIVFTFTAPFAVFGADAIVGVPIQFWKRVTDRASAFGEEGDSGFGPLSRYGHVVAVGLASLLAVFLLLNAGVVSEVVTKDYAPSNSVSQQRLSNSEDPVKRSKAGTCLGCKIQTHIWVFNHISSNITLRGDDLAEAQVDYYRGEITGYVDGIPTGASYASIWTARNGTMDRSYLVFLPHNIDTDGVFVDGKYDWRSFNQSGSILDGYNVVYSTDKSKIYLSHQNFNKS
jgi:hypothetical protein